MSGGTVSTFYLGGNDIAASSRKPDVEGLTDPYSAYADGTINGDAVLNVTGGNVVNLYGKTLNQKTDRVVGNTVLNVGKASGDKLAVNWSSKTISDIDYINVTNADFAIAPVPQRPHCPVSERSIYECFNVACRFGHDGFHEYESCQFVVLCCYRVQQHRRGFH